jgi:hypothetical protein
MSTTIIALIVNLLGTALPFLGLSNITGEQLTVTLNVLLAVGSALFLWLKRYGDGDIKISGVRK